MGPTWDLAAPGGPQVGPMNLAIRVSMNSTMAQTGCSYVHRISGLQCSGLSICQKSLNWGAKAWPLVWHSVWAHMIYSLSMFVCCTILCGDMYIILTLYLYKCILHLLQSQLIQCCELNTVWECFSGYCHTTPLTFVIDMISAWYGRLCLESESGQIIVFCA